MIDLETGDQPIYNEDGTVAVVLNGEIYNYRELRARLGRTGHTLCDAGRHRGRSCTCTRRRDRTACATCTACSRSRSGTRRRRRLVLARDRVGKKPLFYAERDGTLSFASELNALMQDPEIPRDVDLEALDRYLAYRYVPGAPQRLPGRPQAAAGHDARLGGRRVRAPSATGGSTTRARLDVRDAAELHERIRAAIRAAVRKRLVADVPLGAFLSGGIDSSAVVAAMAREAGGRIKTFSIGFEDERFNELAARPRRWRSIFDTDHHEFVVEPDAVEILPKIVRHYGEPFADSSARAELLPRGADAAARDRGAQRRRRRRVVRRLHAATSPTTSPPASTGCRCRCGEPPEPPERACRRAASELARVSRARRLTRGLTLASRRPLRRLRVLLRRRPASAAVHARAPRARWPAPTSAG